MRIRSTGRLLAFLLSTTLVMPQSFPVQAESGKEQTEAVSVTMTEESAEAAADSDTAEETAVSAAETKTAESEETTASASSAETVFSSEKAAVNSESTADIRKITGYASYGVLETINAGYAAKPSLDEVLAKMPSVLPVYLDGSSTAQEVPVTWYCVGENYEESEGYLFQFSPSFSDEYDAGDEMNVIMNAPYINVCLDSAYSGSGISVTEGDDGNEIVSKYANATENVANRDIIFSYLVNDMGLNTAGACGVIANIKYESGYNPTISGDSSTSYGICQWHNGRMTSLINYCTQNNLDYKTLTGQLAYLNYELNTSSYSKILTYLKSVENSEQGAYDAAWYWCYYFEIPASRATASVTRGNYAKNTIWPIYKDATELSAGGAGDESDDTSDSSSDNSDTVSLPSSIAVPTAENTADGIMLSWAEVSEADGYRVYRSSSASGTYTLLEEIGTNDITVYTDTTADGGSTWYYKIAACTGDEVLDTYTNTANLNYRTAPTTSASTVGTIPDGTSISVVRGYSVSSDGYTWFKIKYNGNYYYCVSKYLELESSGTSSGNVTEVLSPAVSLIRLEDTTVFTASNVVAGVKLSWNAVSGADSYTIYRRTGSEDFQKIAVTGSASTLVYTDTASKISGTVYEYKISANCGNVSGPSSVIASLVYVPTPTFGAVVNEKNGFKFSWSQIPGATGYYVYRRVNGGGWYEIAQITDGSVISYTDTNVTSGSSYTYTVRALIGTTMSSYYGGSAALYLGCPTVSVSNVSGGVRISYTKAAGANGYIIYRKLSTETSYQQLAVNVGESVLTYNDTTAVSGKTYNYEVKAIYASGNLYYYTTTASLRYRSGAGTSYAVKGTFASGKKIQCVGGSEVTANGSVWIKVYYNGAYYYCSKKYLTFNGPVSVKTSGMESDAKSILYLSCPAISSLSNQASGITVKWGAVTGANGYDVYRRIVGGGWSRIARITSGSTVSYTDKTAVSGTSYEYTVRAVSGSTMSSWNSIVKIVCLSVPVLSSASKVTGGIKVSWKKVTGASGYYLYRKTAGGGWSKIATIKSGSTVTYTDKSGTKGTRYYYTVRAYYGSYLSYYNTTGVNCVKP